MTYCFLNAELLADAIGLVVSDLGIVLCGDPNVADVTVRVTETGETGLTVGLDGKSASISYGGGTVRFLRALSVLVSWIREGKTEGNLHETPLFDTNGSMIDMSRNAVMNLPTIKFMLRKIALMGMNTFLLYTEDTYEVPERPYFGYMRGRYTKAELQELDRYALTLGIELIPCIQTLGHLATHLRWPAASAYKDTANVLLVGEDTTRELLEDLFRTVSETFTSRRVHVGMDETHDLGTGQSLDKNGYTERSELYFAHLKLVAETAEHFGLKPMMWSDMFFRLYGRGLKGCLDYDLRVCFPDSVRDQVPSNMAQVFWDYYHSEEDFYSTNIDKHRQLSDEVLFAGGIWAWSGHCILYPRSLRNSIAALEACKKRGVKQVIATVWHNGAEAQLILSLAGLAWYADFDYTGRYDIDSVRRCFARATGESYDRFLTTAQPAYLPESDSPVIRALLYNDPLVGLMDSHLNGGTGIGAYYRSVSEKLRAIRVSDGMYDPAFAVIRRLSELLENKADFGVRLKAAYDAGDRKTIAALALECDVIIDRIDALTAAHKAAWMTYNKPFGWEVFDIRYGGLRARFFTAKERITAFLDGSAKHLEELEADRLRFDGSDTNTAPISDLFHWLDYHSIATPSILD